MKIKFDVLGIGISAVDDLFYISEYPSANCKLPIESSARCGGGPACTAIASVGALQGRASYVARLGRDDVSQYIKSELRRKNVDISCMIEDLSGAPYHCIIVVDVKGNRMVLYDPSLYRVVTTEDVSDSLLQSTSILLLDHLSGSAATGIAERARRLGIPTLGDIEGQSEEGLRLAALMDYLIVPEDFAFWATGETRPDHACALLARSQRTATIVTCGSRGCYCLTKPDRQVSHHPAFAVEVFDTTGCGDVFHGAFALAIARGASVLDAVTFSSAAAALKAHSLEGRGHGWNALPTLESVLQFLRARLNEPARTQLIHKLEILRANGTLAV
jgi:sugar/nucleoside kinase (ribokinase family)